MRAASFGTQSLLKGAWEKEETNMEYRRRVPRERAGWDGLCQIEGELATHCKVDDISMFGLGLTLNYSFPPQPEGRRNVYAGTTIGDSVTELVGRRISVDVPAVGDSVSIQLQGKVANAKRMSGEVVRVGIEFDRLAEPASETTALSEFERARGRRNFSRRARRRSCWIDRIQAIIRQDRQARRLRQLLRFPLLPWAVGRRAMPPRSAEA